VAKWLDLQFEDFQGKRIFHLHFNLQCRWKIIYYIERKKVKNMNLNHFLRERTKSHFVLVLKCNSQIKMMAQTLSFNKIHFSEITINEIIALAITYLIKFISFLLLLLEYNIFWVVHLNESLHFLKYKHFDKMTLIELFEEINDFSAEQSWRIFYSFIERWLFQSKISSKFHFFLVFQMT
jgi:hypothetical protein